MTNFEVDHVSQAGELHEGKKWQKSSIELFFEKEVRKQLHLFDL